MNTVYVSAADTSKLIRKDLKAAFPAVKFSVTTKTYSGGASARVRWTDGPTSKQVDAVVGKYEGESFDGMIDLATTIYETLPDGTQRNWGTDYVFTERRHSEAFQRRVMDYLTAHYQFSAPPEFEIVRNEYGDCYVLAGNREARFGGEWALDFLRHSLYDCPENELDTRFPLAQPAAPAETPEPPAPTPPISRMEDLLIVQQHAEIDAAQPELIREQRTVGVVDCGTHNAYRVWYTEDRGGRNLTGVLEATASYSEARRLMERALANGAGVVTIEHAHGYEWTQEVYALVGAVS
jgi:hypothetical protein